ncbi:MAG: hypothetical protein BA863_07585 [Desulfovibrio sp. S3730MH75]|nr:MAG: hypothetical protein BA863_07585 [Desulfovibrio sp. S3730MH75]
MREINGTIYSFGLLDTGIISEVIKNRNDERNALVKLVTGNAMIPCISIWSILELRSKPELYSEFINLFSVIPFCLTKSPHEFFQEELDSYPDPSSIDPFVFTFSMFNKDPQADLSKFMDKLFNNREVRKAEKTWKNKWKKESLDSMLSLKSNFQPKGIWYNADDASRFIDEGVPQFVAGEARNWLKRLLNSNQEFNPHAFPSIKMSFYTVFYRFYAEDRDPEIPDVFDILISSAAPYLDIVITEKFQAEIFKKVRNRDPFLDHVRIENINILRWNHQAG